MPTAHASTKRVERKKFSSTITALERTANHALQRRGWLFYLQQIYNLLCKLKLLCSVSFWSMYRSSRTSSLKMALHILGVGF